MTDKDLKSSPTETPDDQASERRREERRESERRSGRDRRNDDAFIPVKVERRKQVEPRKLEVLEVELTESQWVSNFGAETPKE